MSEVVGLVSFPEEDGHSRRPYSKTLHSLMEAEAKRLINRAYRRTEEVLKQNNDKLKKVKNSFTFQPNCLVIFTALTFQNRFSAGRNFIAERDFKIRRS